MPTSVAGPLSTLAREPQSRFVNAAIELILFFALLATLDVLSKLLLSVPMARLDVRLGSDWLVATTLQATGVALLLTCFAKTLRPDRTAVYSSAAFLALSLVATMLFTGFQDFSPDGQWYHFDRVGLFPLNIRVAGVADAVREGPSIFYPLLVDNLRGLFLSATRSGPFSGVGVNIGIAGAGAVFWHRHAHFLPKWSRALPPICSVTGYQLLTYYVDGSIAVLSAIVFLTSILFIEEMDLGAAPLDKDRNAAIGAAAASGLLFAQLKFTFPVLILSAVAPLTGIPLLSRAGRTIGMHIKWHSEVSAMRLLLVAIGVVLALSNPYWLLVKSIAGFSSYNQFSYQSIQYWGGNVYNMQLRQIFGAETSPFTYFLHADLLALWPGGPHVIDPDIHSGSALAKRLVARIGTEDARFSGYGPLSVIVLIVACCFSASNLLTREKPTLSRVVSLSFFSQLIFDTLDPLGWWARMAPALYTTCCVIILLELARDRSAWWRVILARLSIAIIVVPLFVAPIVLVARSVADMNIVRRTARTFAVQQPSSLVLPRLCPADHNDQISGAIKLAYASSIHPRIEQALGCRVATLNLTTRQICFCEN